MGQFTDTLNKVTNNSFAVATKDLGNPNKLPDYLTLPPPVFKSQEINLTEAGMGPTTLLFKNPGLNIVSMETPAAIMILSKTDNSIQYQTNKFFLQTITKPRQEKFQIIETFGKPHLYFYGERTAVYNIQGILVDAFYESTPQPVTTTAPTTTPDLAYRNQWATGFQNFYRNRLRGSQLNKTNSVAALYVNGWLIKGYPINLTIMKESQSMPDAVSFQMSWVIVDEVLLHAAQTDNYYKALKDSDQLVALFNKKSKLLMQYSDIQTKINDPSWWLGDTTGLQALDSQSKALETQLREVQKEIDGYVNKYSERTRRILNID